MNISKRDLSVSLVLILLLTGLAMLFCSGCTSCLTRIEDKTTTNTNGVVVHETLTTERIRGLLSGKTVIAKGHVSQNTKTNGVTSQNIGVTGFEATATNPLGDTNFWYGVGIAYRAYTGLPPVR